MAGWSTTNSGARPGADRDGREPGAPPAGPGSPREGRRPIRRPAPGGHADHGMTRARGTFIVLEGVEGAGKTTQVARLAEWLRARGGDPVVTREPGGTAVGEAIRAVVLDRELDVPPVSELLLILAARAAFVRDVVRPALDEGRVVLADRYDLSTLAYQGYGRGLDLEEVRRANRLATGGLRPDACVVLDVPVEAGRDRQRRAGKRADRMEEAGTEFLERVRRGYAAAADREPGVYRVDATGMPDAVFERVVGVLRQALPETLAGPFA